MLTELNIHSEQRTQETTRPKKRRVRSFELVTLPLPEPSIGQRCYSSARRILEVVASVGLLLVAIPIMFVAAVAIKLTSPGPVFYSQTRVGKKGRHFTIFKLRSMVHQCESLTGPRWCMADDPRVTRVGWMLRRSHVDELPQLLNVIRGDMSLIGPRPERPEFVRELEKAIVGYRDRETVLPGITGLAQVTLAAETDVRGVRRKLIYDLYYIRRLGALLDLRILCCTAMRVMGMAPPVSSKLFGLPSRRLIESVAAGPADEQVERPMRVAA